METTTDGSTTAAATAALHAAAAEARREMVAKHGDPLDVFARLWASASDVRFRRQVAKDLAPYLAPVGGVIVIIDGWFLGARDALRAIVSAFRDLVITDAKGSSRRAAAAAYAHAIRAAQHATGPGADEASRALADVLRANDRRSKRRRDPGAREEWAIANMAAWRVARKLRGA